MIALYIILGIIAFFVILFSIKVKLTVAYDDVWHVGVQWLFVKLSLVPFEIRKKEKKPEEPKEEKPPEEEKKEEKEEKPKKKKGGKNPLKIFYVNKGVDGFVAILNNLFSALGGMFGRIIRGFRLDKLVLNYVVTGSDAADCAVNFGERSAEIYPALGYICTEMRCSDYTVNMAPAFHGDKDIIDFSAKFSVRPIKLTNAVVILVVNLINKVALKFLMGLKKTNKEK